MSFMDCVNTSVNTLLIFLYFAMNNLTKCVPKLTEKIGKYKFKGDKTCYKFNFFFIKSDIPRSLKCMYLSHRTCFVFCSRKINQNGNKSTTESVRMAAPLCSKECKPASVL